MTQVESASAKVKTLCDGWEEVSRCLIAFDAIVSRVDWLKESGGHFPLAAFIPADEFPRPEDVTLHNWYFTILAGAGWEVVPMPANQKHPNGRWKVMPFTNRLWDQSHPYQKGTDRT